MKNIFGNEKGTREQGQLKRHGNFVCAFWGILVSTMILGFFLYTQINMQSYGSALSEPDQISNMLDAGLAILAIGVSVWVGLNIYNNCKESEIDRKLVELEEKSRTLNAQYKKILFINMLEKTKEMYEISEYFWEEFQYVDIPENVIDDLAGFERDFYGICELYEEQASASRLMSAAGCALIESCFWVRCCCLRSSRMRMPHTFFRFSLYQNAFM